MTKWRYEAHVVSEKQYRESALGSEFGGGVVVDGIAGLDGDAVKVTAHTGKSPGEWDALFRELLSLVEVYSTTASIPKSEILLNLGQGQKIKAKTAGLMVRQMAAGLVQSGAVEFSHEERPTAVDIVTTMRVVREREKFEQLAALAAPVLAANDDEEEDDDNEEKDDGNES